MMLGARTGAWAKSGGWTNPYVTDGLVAMWDGEWNVAGGVHENGTKWVDLVGGLVAKTNNRNCGGRFQSNGLVSDGVHIGASTDMGVIINLGYYSIEIAISLSEDFKKSVQEIVVPFFSGGSFAESTTAGGYAKKGCVFFYSYPSLSRFFEVMNNDRLNGGTKCYTDTDGVIARGFHSFSFSGINRPVKDNIEINGSLALDLVAFASIEPYATQARATFLGVYGNSGSSYRAENVLKYGTVLHCVRVYNRELTAQEVSANYNVDVERFGIS